MILINVKLFRLGFGEFWVKLINKISSGLAMMSTMFIISKLWETNLDTAKVFAVLLLSIITITAGLVVYLFFAWVLKVDEIEYVTKIVKKVILFIDSK